MSDHKQKVLSSKPVFKAQLFEVKELEMEFSTGTKKTFHQVDSNSTVAILPITDKYEIYLIDQYRPMFEKRVLGIIAGHIDAGESSLAAGKRELLEEAGIEAEQWELLTKAENSRSVIRSQVYVYLAKNLELGNAKPEEDEDIILVKMPLADAVKKVLSGEIYHTGSIAGILMLNELKRQKRL